MLYFFHGSDRENAREALNDALKKVQKHTEVVRITDAHSLADLQAALSGPGMFSGKRTAVLDGVLGGTNQEMRDLLMASLEAMRDSGETFYVLEGALDAATRKLVEKYAEDSKKFDAAKKEKDNSIFALANALQKGDKKALWVGLVREFQKGSAPEAVHGLLFWGAKQMLLRAGKGPSGEQGRFLVAALAELPHEARRKGEDLEYALERFVLSLPPFRA